MKTVQLTIKNYRCFSDAQPARFAIGPGITAVLGANNAGKSTLMLLIYELRQLFHALGNSECMSPNLMRAITGVDIQTNYAGTTDPQEIFTNSNDRNISLDIELVDLSKNPDVDYTINRIVCVCRRSEPNLWLTRGFSIEHPGQALELPSGYEPEGELFDPNQDSYDTSDLLEVICALRDAKYYGPFRNAINQGSASHFDFQAGTAFIDLWNSWKTSGNKAQSRIIDKITDEIRRLFDFGRLEINASMSLKTLMVSVDGQPYRLGELGSGISQFIMVLANAATASPSLILIDEPETNLHPALQIDFLLTLAQYAKIGCVFSTHSVGLARSVSERIYSIKKNSEGALLRPFEATTSYSEFLGELSFSTFKEMGFDRLLLVEGVNDVKVVQQLLRLFGKDHATVILPLGGDQMVNGHREAELAEIKRLSNNIYALVDSERHSSSALPAERRRKFAEVCLELHIDCCVTEFRAIENYFTDKAVKAAFGSSFERLEPYERLDKHANGWSKSENWRVARYLLKEDLVSTDIGTFLDKI